MDLIFFFENFSIKSNCGFLVISKRDADYDEHHGLYHHIKRFWKNSWYKAKRGVEGKRVFFKTNI